MFSRTAISKAAFLVSSSWKDDNSMTYAWFFLGKFEFKHWSSKIAPASQGLLFFSKIWLISSVVVDFPLVPVIPIRCVSPIFSASNSISLRIGHARALALSIAGC